MTQHMSDKTSASAFLCEAETMAQRISSHTRSISLPSRSHPSAAAVEEHLCRLKSSAASVCNKLGDLKDLLDSVDDMLRLPLIQQALSDKHNDKCVEEVLDGSLKVLDVCGTSKDIMSQMKECVQDLESSFRRRKGRDVGLAEEVSKYMISQKKANKKVSECLGNLKRMSRKNTNVLVGEEAIVDVLREVEKMSLSVLESVLLSISQQKRKSFVSKLKRPKRGACQGEYGDDYEVEKMSAALRSFNSEKKLNVEQVQTLLEALDSSILEIEDGLESVFRRLLKTRVSLLNILSH